MLSTTSAAGRSRTTASSIASSLVAEYTTRPSGWTPSRSARPASCSTDSSPETYITLGGGEEEAMTVDVPSSASSASSASSFAAFAFFSARSPRSPAICKTSVDFPTPGSPPTSISAPGTIPPPRTRSTSAPSSVGTRRRAPRTFFPVASGARTAARRRGAADASTHPLRDADAANASSAAAAFLLRDDAGSTFDVVTGLLAVSVADASALAPAPPPGAFPPPPDGAIVNVLNDSHALQFGHRPWNWL
jgi:hypothetical protein